MKRDPLAYFRDMDKAEQEEHILEVAALCIDGAPVSLARKIEIFLDATGEDQQQRLDTYHEAKYSN